MIEAIDNMGDVEEEDIDEEGNSTFKQSQPTVPVKKNAPFLHYEVV